MKYKVFANIILMIATSSVSAIQFPNSYGRTHFIIGAPPGEIIAQDIEHIPDDDMCCAYFSPDDNLQALLCDHIAQEQEEIDIAIFALSDKKIADELIHAYKRGVRIRVITDPSAMNDRFGKIFMLHEHGIPVHVYNMRYKKKGSPTLSDIMHNKFVIFKKNKTQKPCIWTGSFNFTKSAALSNQENVVIIRQPKIVTQYNAQFERLITRSKRLRG